MMPGITGGEARPGAFSFNMVSLLLHADGSNGSTTFTDNSLHGHVPTVLGNLQITTTNPKFGTGAALSDGTGDALAYAAHSSFNMGSKDFTVEGFKRLDSVGTRMGLISQTNSAGQNSATSIFVEVTTTGEIQAFVAYSGNNTSPLVTAAVPVGSYFHWAFERWGNFLNLYLDGVGLTPQNIGSIVVNSSAEDLQIGQNKFQSTGLIGRWDEVRITRGFAHYKGDFTPPAAPFPNS